jgi:hypothetical protein
MKNMAPFAFYHNVDKNYFIYKLAKKTRYKCFIFQTSFRVLKKYVWYSFTTYNFQYCLEHAT